MLSVCCQSNHPLARVAALHDQLGSIAGEVICAVDARVPTDELRELNSHADVVVRYEFDPLSPPERYLAWLHSLCSGRWVLRLDSDEVVSSALFEVLPTLLSADNVLQYVIRRRWLFPDAEHMLDERPWSDDWQIRLVRNEPSVLHFPGVLHSSAELVAPYRYVDEPIYHLDCVLRTLEQREAKTRRYRQIRSEHKTEDGIPVNDFYLPERRHRGDLVPVPPEDVPLIREVLDASSDLGLARIGTVFFRSWRLPTVPPSVVGLDEIDRLWACRSVPPSAYHARMELLEPFHGMHANEVRSIMVRVHNEGTETWPWGARQPEIRLGYRWFELDGVTLCVDGERTPFSSDVASGTFSVQKMTVIAPAAPGGYLLELNVLHEHVTWFEGGLRLSVSVT